MEHLGGIDIVIINPFTAEGLLCAVIVKIASDTAEIIPFHLFHSKHIIGKRVLIISSLAHEQYSWDSSKLFVLENRFFRKSICEKMPSERRLPLVPMALYQDKPSYEMAFDFFFSKTLLTLPQFFIDYNHGSEFFSPWIRSNYDLEDINSLINFCSGWPNCERDTLNLQLKTVEAKKYNLVYRTSRTTFVKTYLPMLHPEVAELYDSDRECVVYSELSLIPKLILVSIFNIKNNRNGYPQIKSYFDGCEIVNLTKMAVTMGNDQCTFFATIDLFKSYFGIEP